jgi:hypothetical protein
VPPEVHAVQAEVDTFGAQAPALFVWADAVAQRDASAVTHHAVPGHALGQLVRQRAQCPPDGARAARHSEEPRDLAISRHTTPGDARHHRVDRGEEAGRFRRRVSPGVAA